MAGEATTATGDSQTGGNTGAGDSTTLLGTPPAAAPAKPAADTTSEQPKPDPAKPADLELKLPEGFDAKDPLLDKFKPLAKEFGLDSPKAQKLLDLYAEAQKPAREAVAAYDAEVKGWAESVKKDPEIGGAKFAENVATAARAVAKFGGAELQKVLESTGLGNHPAVVKAFLAIGKSLGEDTVAGPRDGAPKKTPSNDPEALAKALYPTMFNGGAS